MTEQGARYAAAWARLRRLSRAHALLLLSFVPGVMLFAKASIRITASALPSYAVEVLWLVCIALGMVRGNDARVHAAERQAHQNGLAGVCCIHDRKDVADIVVCNRNDVPR